MALVLQCTNYDASSQTCTAQTWAEVPTVLPPLSVDDALLLSGKILLVWGIAFGLRTIARFIWRG